MQRDRNNRAEGEASRASVMTTGGGVLLRLGPVQRF
jgi:hypothetical protein